MLYKPYKSHRTPYDLVGTSRTFKNENFFPKVSFKRVCSPRIWPPGSEEELRVCQVYSKAFGILRDFTI